MVDVAEDGDDRRPRLQHLRLVLFLLDDDFVAGFLDDRVEAELARDRDRLVGEMFWLIVAIVPMRNELAG